MNSIPEDINNFYQQLESIESFNKGELLKKIKPLSEIYTGHWKEVLIIERLTLQFDLIDGELKPIFTRISEDGKEIGFPLISDFSKDACSYIKNRTQLTKNDFLIARYNHILFNIEKNQLYAINAMNAYKKIINLKVNDVYEERVIDSVKAILKLTEITKYQLEQTKKDLVDLVYNKTLSIYDRYYIAEALLNSKIFKIYELNFLPELSLDWIQQTQDRDYFFNINL